jgi:hypothetical protein
VWRVRLRSAACGVLGALIVAAPAAARAPTRSAELIVGFRDGVSAAEQAQVLAPWAGKVRKRWDRIRASSTSPNYVLRATPSDPHFDLLWGLEKIGAPPPGR